MRTDPLELRETDAFRCMATIRRFEQRTLELASEGLIAGSIHPCLGQEAIPVGALASLRGDDRVLATYRGHGWAIACGVPLAALLGELCQRAGGVNGGRAGSPLLIAPEWGFLGENSIVGAGVPISAGVALASRLRGLDRVVITSIGEGALSQGSTHEGLTFAAAMNLPLIVVVENNGWAEMTRSSTMTRGQDLASRGAAYGIPAQVVDGGDPFAVRDAVAWAADCARDGSGPVLIEARVHRLGGHYNRDVEHYRSKEDREAAQRADPLVRLRDGLIDSGKLSAAELDELEREVSAAIDGATAAVREMAAPDPETARSHVYAGGAPGRGMAGSPDGTTELTYVKAVTAALERELETREDVLVYGEDVGVAGGIFGASRGLQVKFGAERVFDTPIAESAILGSAVGAAIEGMRPVVEIMWADFLLVALDQLINQAANVRYVSSSELGASLVVRTQQGTTPGSCAQHSQSLEALLAHIPGLKVGLAATPGDAYAMLRSAIADADPVVLFEARSLYQVKGHVDLAAPVDPVGGARVHREGGDAVIFSWGAMAPRAIDAADQLAARGVEACVVDLRWLRPLDDETIERVVRAGDGKVLIVHEANVTGGFGAELASRIHERHFDYLDHPVVRLGLPDTPVPSAPVLQAALMPDATAIAEAVDALLRGALEGAAAAD